MPIKLRRGLFTTSAIDNIDHNPSSNTAQGSFHAIGISLFQNISEGNPGCEREAIVMANDTGSVTKSICSLPEWYAEVHPALLRGERAQPPDMGRPEGADGCFLSRAITDEFEWLDQVKISVNQESYQGETPVAWAAHHANLQPKQTVMPAITSLLPLFPR